MTNPIPAAELRTVRKAYQGGPNPLTVLRDVSLTVPLGATLAVTGPSGSGKSTLLNLLGMLDVPDSGHVLIGGQDVAKLPESERAKLRNHEVGFIFQLHHLLPQCTVLENVLMPCLAYRAATADDRERAHELLTTVGLAGRTRSLPGELSGGERQRIAVVRALINNPKIILADEPTGALDASQAGALTELLLHVNAEYRTALIVVTHSIALADRIGTVYTLVNGILAARLSTPQPTERITP